MKKYLFIFLLLTGCTTVPVTQKFPEAPQGGLERCPRLLKLQYDAKLSDIAGNMILNYSSYNVCDLKNDAWIEWYTKQNEIYKQLK